MNGRIQVSRDALARELGGEVLVLDLRTSLYFGMTGTAARIWQLVEAGATRETIVETLAEEYGGDRDVIGADVDGFLAELLERGLLDRAGP
ncbi:MAG TPA: PqqD family protein [Vicinamibacterales bacterium]|nr:PqqD family protein [Vicinamibacterales bacterium]